MMRVTLGHLGIGAAVTAVAFVVFLPLGVWTPPLALTVIALALLVLTARKLAR